MAFRVSVQAGGESFLAEAWGSAHDTIRFAPILCAALPDVPRMGRRGLVHEAVREDLPDLSRHQVYVCGCPAMVAVVRRDFIGRCRLPKDELLIDSFEFANDATSLRC